MPEEPQAQDPGRDGVHVPATLHETARPNTGDSQIPDGEVNLFIPNDPPAVQPQGDRVAHNTVHLVENTDIHQVPTAGERRALNYVVSDTLADDERAPGGMADTPLSQGVRLHIEQPPYAGEPGPEEPVVVDVQTPAPEVIADPTPEQQGARNEEERAAADEVAEQLREQADPVFQAGRQARLNDEPRTSNPHDGRKAEGRAWYRGYDSIDSEGA